MSGNASPGTSHSPTYYYFNTTMAPFETKMNSLQRGPKSILTNATDNDRRSPVPGQKFVHFAPRAIDNENNEFKTKTNNEKQKKDATAFNITSNSKRNRFLSSSELNKAGSSRTALGSTQIKSPHRAIREKPSERRSRMKVEIENSTSSQGRQFKLLAPNTAAQYIPRVPSPPMNRGPPATPRPARLPTPDLENPRDYPLNFCDCLRCYEAGMLGRDVESRREVLASSKMENQYQAATAYIRDRRPVVREQGLGLIVVPREDSHTCNLMGLGYPRNVAINALEAYGYNFEEVDTPVRHRCRY
ncbi:ffb52e22-a047-4a91-bfce-a7eea9186a06 [Sclerotinia trifoliorum]|uniref:Ffb52e22-a047-4a91-bfce-a7eea9186a06 n=1 Tax=Sclerotinia trifoliorum TaxID=28548 RepID=A0A8H2ZM38_9HELO|nr:ffb52e22-a047-4a91-bfce-a7eea9186a06 [Sclerotinia trifoliorum]